jgi:hypothetical protein
MTTEIERDR